MEGLRYTVDSFINDLLTCGFIPEAIDVTLQTEDDKIECHIDSIIDVSHKGFEFSFLTSIHNNLIEDVVEISPQFNPENGYNKTYKTYILDNGIVCEFEWFNGDFSDVFLNSNKQLNLNSKLVEIINSKINNLVASEII